MRKLHDWLPNPLGYTNADPHETGDVWEDSFDKNWPYRLQGPVGRVAFRNKEDAENVRDIMKEILDAKVQGRR